MLTFIIVMLIIGFVAGILARALVPGADPMSLGATTLLGIAGSFVGGFLGYLLFRNDAADGALQPAGIVGSVIGGIIVLLIYRSMGERRSFR